MTAIQMGITIAVCTAATMLTRFLPFVVFSSKDQQPPEVVRYLGRVLLVTVALHKWKHETLLSVAGGTLCYVLLVQLVF